MNRREIRPLTLVIREPPGTLPRQFDRYVAFATVGGVQCSHPDTTDRCVPQKAVSDGNDWGRGMSAVYLPGRFNIHGLSRYCLRVPLKNALPLNAWRFGEDYAIPPRNHPPTAFSGR